MSKERTGLDRLSLTMKQVGYVACVVVLIKSFIRLASGLTVVCVCVRAPVQGGLVDDTEDVELDFSTEEEEQRALRGVKIR